jgi:hypothetical protein
MRGQISARAESRANDSAGFKSGPRVMQDTGIDRKARGRAVSESETGKYPGIGPVPRPVQRVGIWIRANARAESGQGQYQSQN